MEKRKTIKTQEYSFTVIYEFLEKGYQVTVPLLPGLITYGRTFEEAKEMARDAIKCHLEALAKDKEKIPKETELIQEKLTVAFSYD